MFTTGSISVSPFWDWLIRENQAGNVYSIERVGDEVLAGDEELAKWAQGGDLFIYCNFTRG